MKTQTAEELKTKFLNLYHNFVLSDEWEGNFEDDLTKIALDHTTTQIEALRERLNDRFVGGDARIIDETINNFLKEINDGK
jgi:hypothetical protein